MREKVFSVIIAACFALLIAGLFYAQIIKGSFYKKLSEQNRIVAIPLEAPRGKIYDRNGNILVDNRISFNVAIVYDDVKNMRTLQNFLLKTINVDEKQLTAGMLKAKARRFVLTDILKDTGRTNAVILEQYRIDYPGLFVTTEPKRGYPNGIVASSVIGYLGEIGEEALYRYKPYGYKVMDLIGQSGLEKEYDSYLKGVRGGMQAEIDSLGRQRGVLQIKEPSPGKDLYLTIDLELEKYCDELINDKRGSIICMNPNTGAILALVSKPNFDPSVFIKSGKKTEAMSLIKNEACDYPLLNRAISCAYPPGSIFKVVVMSAALQAGKATPETIFECAGFFKLGKSVFRCWRKDGHGAQAMEDALKNSCNVYFYQLGLRTGVDAISLYANKLGYGAQTGIDLPGEISGLVPSADWKKLIKKESWYPGDTVNYSIGQGYLLVTPIQVTRMMSAVSNGGYLVRPYLVESIGEVKVDEIRKEPIGVSDKHLKVIMNGLKKVVNDHHGTGMKARMKDITVAGKTGTAQNPEGKDHGWFCGFAPFEDPKICVSVFIEFGGKGGIEASIYARKVMEKAKELGLF